jgi:hypothetical protein
VSVFSGLRKRLSGKEFDKLINAMESAEEERESWAKDTESFINGGKMPAQTSADIDKLMTDAEKLAVEGQKKLKSGDERAKAMASALEDIQKMKIAHRKHVGTLLGHYEILDKSGAKEVSKSAKAAVAVVEDTKTQAAEAMRTLIAAAQKGKKDANDHILKKGGYVHSQAQHAERIGKLLGRPVKSAIDFNEFKTANDRVNSDLDKLIKAFEIVAKSIQKI